MAQKVSIGQYANKVAKMGDDFEAAALKGIRSAAYRLEGMVTEQIALTEPYPPIDTGELQRATHTNETRKGAVVTNDAPHAPFMEYGTRPHFPPLEPLAEWAYRKGFADSEEEAMAVAFAVARKISEKGISPRAFMARAIAELKRRRIVYREIVKALKEEGLPKVVLRGRR